MYGISGILKVSGILNIVLKGITTKQKFKCFFGVYTKFNIVCTICQYNFVMKNVCIGKISCLFEVNEMSDHVVL